MEESMNAIICTTICCFNHRFFVSLFIYFNIDPLWYLFSFLGHKWNSKCWEDHTEPDQIQWYMEYKILATFSTKKFCPWK